MPMRLVTGIMLALFVLALAACADANGSAQGGGSEYGSYARVKMGVPF
jgi:hypothetical protein